MGGKQKKQAQRTKGNTRPSSSSRSAVRLMQVDGSSIPGSFVGLHQQQPGVSEPFGTIGLATVGQLSLCGKGTEGSSAVIESDDGDCRMLMKKMSKKDSITRLKALQEFQAYCTTCSEVALIAALPFWPRLYNRLSSDYDRRVREASHKAHGQLVSRAGRNLAPHLKVLMGPWLMGRCDPHGPASSAANAAFSEAFKGPAKQIDALVFCKEDIINHVSDVVYNQTPQSLCDAEICTVEESESTHSRLVSAALLALTLYLNVVPTSEHDKFVDAYACLLEKPKFWKFPKSQEASIRASWFDLMSAFCRIQPHVLEPYLARSSPLLLGALDEEDPVVCPLVWEASVQLIVAHKASWSHVNVQKAVIPKLLSIAKRGFEGNAVATCPNLLLFLSNIPEGVLKDKHHFYNGLFTNMILGLELPNVQPSPSEGSAIVSALVECIRYVASMDTDFEEEFLLTHLIPVVESSLMKNSSTLSTTSLYALLGDYLTSKRGQQLEATFWNKIGPLCISAVNQLDDEESRFILERLTYMFSCFAGGALHTGPTPKKSSKRKVKFVSMDNNSHDRSPCSEKEIAIKRTSCCPEGPFLAVAAKLCAALQEHYVANKSADHLEFLARMVPNFATPLLFQGLLTKDDIGESADVSVLGMKYFEVFLKQWLCDSKVRSTDEKDDRIYAALVKLIIHAVLPLVSSKDQSSVLSEVCLLNDVTILEKLLRMIMADDAMWLKEPAIRNWITGSTLARTILTFTEASLKNTVTCGTTCKDDQATWRLLTLCFESFNNFEPILPVDVLNVILDTLRTATSDLAGTGSSTGSVVDEVLMLVAKLAKGLFIGMPNCWKIAACEDILLAFFVILCRPCGIKMDTARVLEDLLTDGTELLVSNKGCIFEPIGFLYKVAMHVHDMQVMARSTHHLETMAKLFVVLLLTVQRAMSRLPQSDNASLIIDILDLALLNSEEQRPIESEAVQRNLLDLMMQGELCIQSPPQHLELSNHSTSVLLASSYFASEALIAVLTSDCSFEDRLVAHVMKILFASTHCKVCYHSRNKLVCSAESMELQKWGPRLGSSLRIIIQQLSRKSLSNMLSECLRMSESHGLLWSYALIELEDLILSVNSDFAVDHEKMLDVNKALSCQGALHNIQLHLTSQKITVILGHIIVKNVLDHPETAGGNVNCLAILASSLHQLEEDDVHAIMDIVPKCVALKWDAICQCVQVCRLLAGLVNEHAEVLTRDHWDYLLCSLGTWLEKVDVVDKRVDQLFATSVFRLATSVSSAVAQLKSNEKLNLDLRTEWDEFFAERIYGRLLFLFVVAAERHTGNQLETSLPWADKYVLESLAKSCTRMPASVTGLGLGLSQKENELPVLLVPDWDDDEDQSTPVRIKTALNHLCPLLQHCFRAIQYGAYHALRDLIFNLSKSYNATRMVKEDVVKEEDSKNASIPGALLATLTHSKRLLEEGPLAEFKPGDNGHSFIENGAHDCSEVVGFLLAWDLVLNMFSQSSSEIRSYNASYMRENGLVLHLLNSLFCLMPNNVNLPDVAASLSSRTPGKNATTRRTMFSEKPLLDPEASRSVCDVQHLACSVYMEAVQHIPALVRDWFNGLDRRTSSLVERFTVTNVSPLLCSKDLAAVRLADCAHLLRGLKVRVRPGAREVLATCTVEEISFEIVVRLADNHPLGPIIIEAGRPIGVSNSQWSYWTLQLTTFLMHQNGSILDGLLLWKRNIDKKFEGVQECYVCFYVLHGTSYQLPKHVCRTCKKKFHSSCLYKWFSTSGHSTCPLCRSIF